MPGGAACSGRAARGSGDSRLCEAESGGEVSGAAPEGAREGSGAPQVWLPAPWGRGGCCSGSSVCVPLTCSRKFPSAGAWALCRERARGALSFLCVSAVGVWGWQPRSSSAGGGDAPLPGAGEAALPGLRAPGNCALLLSFVSLVCWERELAAVVLDKSSKS